MKYLSRWSAAAALFTFLFAARAVPAQSPDVFRLLPKDLEVIAAVRVSELLSSELADHFLEEHLGENKRQRIEALQNLIGVDLLEDVHLAMLAGIVDDEESMAIIVKAEYESERLLSFVQLSESYKKEQIDGLAVHSWDDGGTTKYACEPAENTLLVTQSREVLDACLKALANSAESFGASPYAAQLAAMPEATVRAAFFEPDPDRSELGELAKAMRFSMAGLSIDLDGDEMEIRAYLMPEDESLTPAAANILRGFLAVGVLQGVVPEASELAGSAIVEERRDEGVAEARLRLTNDQLFRLIERLEEL